MSAAIEFDGVRYDLKYTMAVRREIREAGVFPSEIMLDITKHPARTMDYLEAVSRLIAILLNTSGGAAATVEAVYDWLNTDEDTLAEAYRIFYWAVAQSAPPVAMKRAAKAKKAKAPRTKATTSRTASK